MLNKDQFFKGLITCVMTQGKMGIPGFGTFVKRRLEAQPDPVAGVIHPPGNLFVLQPFQQGDPTQLELMADFTGYSTEDIQIFTEALVKEWKFRFDNKEIIEIAGFGRIFQEFTGELNFVQELSTAYSNPSNLPILPFRPISREFAQRPEVVRRKKWSRNGESRWTKIKKQITKTELLPITVAAASFLIILAFYLLMPKQPDFNNQSLAEKKATVERVNQKPSHQLEPTFANDTISQADTAAEEARLEAEVEAVIEKSSTTALNDPPAETATPEVILPNTKTAIIITGGYRNIEGVKRKINQIVSLGFNPYQDKKGDINRVGVQFTYQSQADFQRIMDQVQNQISARAWLLEE